MQQNRTILAVDDDNFTDIAIRYTQNAENAFLLAELNGMNVDDIIASGTEILIPAKSEAPVIFVQKKVTEIEPTTSALLELQKKHSATVATAQQLGHVRSGSQIRVKEDGTMEVIGGGNIDAFSGTKYIINLTETLKINEDYEYNVTQLIVDGVIECNGIINLIS